jgi:signal transduction histidine kinase
MNAILGYAQLLENDPSMAEAPRKKASVIRSSGDHLLQLVNDVLEMSRIEAGRKAGAGSL